MQTAETGFFTLAVNNKKFNLVASLRNMAKIASATRILLLYDVIHSRNVPDAHRVNLAHEILTACSDNDKIEKYLIKHAYGEVIAGKNAISANDQVHVAAALMRHGIAGVNRPKNAGSGKPNKKKIEKFDINRVVAEAMIHFGLSKTEALDLTMSEFYYLLAAKFPEDSVKQDIPSVDAHREVMKAFYEGQK